MQKVKIVCTYLLICIKISNNQTSERPGEVGYHSSFVCHIRCALILFILRPHKVQLKICNSVHSPRQQLGSIIKKSKSESEMKEQKELRQQGQKRRSCSLSHSLALGVHSNVQRTVATRVGTHDFGHMIRKMLKKNIKKKTKNIIIRAAHEKVIRNW